MSPGTARWPRIDAAGSILIRRCAVVEHGSDDDAVPLRLEDRGRPLGLLLAGDEDRQGAAALGGEVLEVEVGDVDPLGAERLRDPGDHAGPVGDVDAQALERAGIVVGGLEQAPPVRRRLADPAGEKARVAGLERRLDLLDPAPVLGERGRERDAVLEEDVDPDPRVRAGDPRHVPERAAGRRERLVPLDARAAGVVQEHVRERVRQMARDRDEAIVGVGIDGDRDRAERRDEAVHEPVALGLGRRHGGQEPRRALEELRGRALGSAGFRAADRMAADEARLSGRGGADAALRRADVRDGARRPARVEHGPHLGGKRGHRRRHDRELGVGEGGGEVGGRLDGASLRRRREMSFVGIPAGHALDSGTPRAERDGRADQPRADDGERSEAAPLRQIRISSATRKARSSDWRAFRRGSQRLS